jgi:hypothetical protein
MAERPLVLALPGAGRSNATACRTARTWTVQKAGRICSTGTGATFVKPT